MGEFEPSAQAADSQVLRAPVKLKGFAELEMQGNAQCLCCFQVQSKNQKALLAWPVIEWMLRDTADEGDAAMRQFFLQRLLPCLVRGFFNQLTPWIASRQVGATVNSVPFVQHQQFSAGLSDLKGERLFASHTVLGFQVRLDGRRINNGIRKQKALRDGGPTFPAWLLR